MSDSARHRSAVSDDDIVRKENAHGAMKTYVRVDVTETQTVEVLKRLRNPITDRTHDLTKLSDDGYLKPFIAFYHATNRPDVVDLGDSPVLTFDKDRWELAETDEFYAVVKREAETKLDEVVLGNDCNVDTGTERGEDL